MSLEQLLSQSLQQQGLVCDSTVLQKIIAYLDLLQKWNRVYNLTAVRETKDMVPLHIMDALSALPYLQGGRILDVGSGAGLPGIPLAIFESQKHFTLLDSNGKKTRFLQQVKSDLGLQNVTIETNRVENYATDEKFDTVISRAFTSIAKMLELTGNLCGNSGLFVAMKGEYPAEELQSLREGFIVDSVHRLNVAGLDAQRHIVCIRSNSNVALSL